MDQHGEKEENKSQDSALAAEQREETAAEEGEDTSEESTDQRVREGGYKADESTGLLPEDDVGSGEASAAPPFAHPCSLLRACAGFLGLHGCGGDRKPPAAAVAAAAAEAATAAAASSSQDEEDAGVEMAKANPPQGFYMHEVIARVWAVAVGRPRPRPPDHEREGSGGNGGVHH